MRWIIILVVFATALFSMPYTGFMKLQKGAWAKYEILSQDKNATLTLKYLGTTLYKGKKVNIVESEMVIDGYKIVTQNWSAVDNDAVIKKVITKTPTSVICFEEEMIGMMGDNTPYYHTKTPKEYSPKKPNIKIATYTLPNGKKIKAAIFKDKGLEVWVSSQVPFGIVKVVENGKTTMRLVDFGLSGAKPAISLKEAQSCTAPMLPVPR